MTIHIIGAGLAGLSAAVNLAKGSKNIILYEATGQAGGRCRSFYDLILGVHFLLMIHIGQKSIIPAIKGITPK